MWCCNQIFAHFSGETERQPEEQASDLLQLQVKECQLQPLTLQESLSLCPPGQFACRGGSCISQAFVCDGKTDCPCRDDENLCTCSGVTSFLHQIFGCYRNILQFVEKEKQTHLTNTNRAEDSIIQHEIPIGKWCLYEKDPQTRTPLHSPYGEHLLHCEAHNCNKHFKCKLSYCIPYSSLCDNQVDCPLKEDESLSVCSQIKCKHMFRCRSQLACISVDAVCDGITHCLKRDDEIACTVTQSCPDTCTCMINTIFCSATTLPTLLQLEPNFRATMQFLNIQADKFELFVFSLDSFFRLHHANLSDCNITHVCFEPSLFSKFSSLQYLELSRNNFKHLEKKLFSKFNRFEKFPTDKHSLSACQNKHIS